MIDAVTMHLTAKIPPQHKISPTCAEIKVRIKEAGEKLRNCERSLTLRSNSKCRRRDCELDGMDADRDRIGRGLPMTESWQCVYI